MAPDHHVLLPCLHLHHQRKEKFSVRLDLKPSSTACKLYLNLTKQVPVQARSLGRTDQAKACQRAG